MFVVHTALLEYYMPVTNIYLSADKVLSAAMPFRRVRCDDLALFRNSDVGAVTVLRSAYERDGSRMRRLSRECG